MRLPPRGVEGMNETVAHRTSVLSVTQSSGSAAVCYVSAAQATPAAAEGLLSAAVTCEVRRGFL